jgi:PAS domain S-box-containing protein
VQISIIRNTASDSKALNDDKKKRPVSQQLIWFTMIVSICGVIAAGILTNITLRSIEKNLPSTLLAELNDLSFVLENLFEVVNAAENAKTQPSIKNLNLLRDKVKIVYISIVELRESYVFDNLIQASAFHAVVAPAIADLQIWLTDGVSGFGPDTDTTAAIAFVRIHEAFQKARSLNRDSKIRAQKILEEQRKRLDRFLFSVNLFFALTILIIFSMVYLLIRQYVLQQREATAQAELSDQRDLLNSLFENVLLGITVWNQEGGLLLSNRGLADIIGYSRKDIKTLDDWFFRAYPDLAYRSKILLDWKESSGQKSAIRESKVTCKNGEVKDIEFRSTFLSDGRALVTMSDITERKRAEEALRESEEKHRIVLETSMDPIVVYDTEGKVTYFNPAFTRIFGWTLEECLGKKMDLFVPEDAWSETQKMVEKVLAGESFSGFETRRYTKDGNIIHVNMSAAIYKDTIGKPIGSVINLRDITEQKNLESQLQQAHKMESIGTLAGGIAHDFNNILSSVFGFTELALDDAKRGTLQHKHLQEILIAGDRAKNLVKQILTFSRQVDQEQKPIQVKPIVKEALKLLRASIPTTIDIKENVKSNSLVIGDSTQIHQVLMNLCTNAAHAMEDDGGLLTASLSNVELDSEFVSNHPNLKPGPYINLTVTDTGHGISPDVMEKIFDPFFTTKEEGKGTGMGLSVVHGIVRSHEGDIYVYSEPGEGSTFKVYLPAIERRLKPEDRIEKPIPTGTERILFVDDEPAIVNMGKQILASLGYNVVIRTSSIEALEYFKAQPDKIDLVITDMTMPKMTGEVLANELRRVRSDIPVILCTGFSARMDEKNPMDMGIQAFVSKPVLKREIAEAIRTVLDSL